MDFFDSAVSKAKEAIDVACKKTNEVVNTGRQKYDVAALESKLEKDFSALGKIYFESIKDNELEDGDTKILVEAVKDKNAKIEEIKQELLTSKSRRICPACGAAIDDTAVFCSVCGQKVIISNED